MLAGCCQPAYRRFDLQAPAFRLRSVDYRMDPLLVTALYTQERDLTSYTG